MVSPLPKKLRLERLEDRCLLAYVEWVDGLVMITGTEGDDALVFRQDGDAYVVDGLAARIPIEQAQRVVALLLGGNDFFRNETSLPARIAGGSGDDELLGGPGNDELLGESGIDQLFGNAGEDFLDGGGEANDVLDGGDGLDRVAGIVVGSSQYGAITIYGTDRNDQITVRIVDGFAEIDGAGLRAKLLPDSQIGFLLGAGDDTLINASPFSVVAYGGDGDDTMRMSSTYNNELYGEAGNDILENQSMYYRLEGGDGIDQLNGTTAIEWFEKDANGLSLYAADGNATLLFQGPGSQFALPGMTNPWIPFGNRVKLYLADGNNRVANLSFVPMEIVGGAGNDVILGGKADDVLYGNGGRNLVLGGAGNDRIYATQGLNHINGGFGNDRFEVSGFSQVGPVLSTIDDPAGEDTLYFGSIYPVMMLVDGNIGTGTQLNQQVHITARAADIIVGSSANDYMQAAGAPIRLEGGAGDDVLQGGSGAQQLLGGLGNDTLDGGDGDDVLDGEQGNDSLSGGIGNDTYVFDRAKTTGDDDTVADLGGQNTLDFRKSTGALTLYTGATSAFAVTPSHRVVRRSDGFAGLFTTVYGTSANDYIVITNNGVGATVYSGDGADTVKGGSGDDYLVGGTGINTFFGGAGNDVLLGMGNSDLLQGEAGDDVVAGNSGKDSIDGGEGNDRLWGDQAPDFLRDSGADNEDTVNGGAGDDELYGGDFKDRLEGGLGNDLVSGGLGDDTFRFGESASGEFDRLLDHGGSNSLDFQNVTTSLHLTTAATTGFLVSDLRTIERVLESTNGVFTTIYGGNFGDVIDATGQVAVSIYAGMGNNKLIGGSLDDYIMGSSGIDTIYGGSGRDSLYGRDGDDWVEGGADNDSIFGGGHSDHLSGDDGNDSIQGDDTPPPPSPPNCGNIITPYPSSFYGNDILLGGLGDDYLQGLRGNDWLEGNEGADVLMGQEGTDRLDGGAGSDALYPESTKVDDNETIVSG